MQEKTLSVKFDNFKKHYKLDYKDGFIFCLYEAISNSLYSCIENKSKIDIFIKLERQYPKNEIRGDSQNYIKSFTITDNGIGFTEKNFDNFTKKLYESDTTQRKGIGRFAFIKVFKNVSIESIFKENDKIFKRQFLFNSQYNDTKQEIDIDNKIKTTIKCDNFEEDYQKYTKRELNYYIQEIIKHFYTFFIYLKENNKEFNITIQDDCETNKISIDDQLFKNDETKKESFTIKNIKFTLLHIKTNNIKNNGVFYVVDERTVGEITNIDLPFNLRLSKDGKEYFYYCFVQSEYLSKFLNEERTELNLPLKNENDYSTIGSVDVNCIFKDDIENLVKEKIENYLKEELEEAKTNKIEKIKKILSNNSKYYNNKAFLYIFNNENSKNELLDKINCKDTEKTILTKVKSFHEELKERTVNSINNLIKNINGNNKFKDNIEEIKNKIIELTEQVNEENTVELSSYIMYRKYVLDLFNKTLEQSKTKNITDEAFFHNLFFKKHTNNPQESNMWLFDDQFLYFDGISETQIKDITLNNIKIIREDLTDDDLKLLNEFNNKRLERRIDLLFFPSESKCIIIELKSPNIGIPQNLAQMDEYVKLIANYIKPEYKIEQFYTYLITDNFNKVDYPTGYKKMYGLNGFYRKSIDVPNIDNGTTIANQYSEVIEYSDIYKRASKRNNIFFEKLGI